MKPDYHRHESERYGITPDGDIVTLDNRDDKADPLWVQQRDPTWSEESHIASYAALNNGRLDPSRVLPKIIQMTIEDSNWLGHVDLDEIDRDFGWHLYDWLGGTDLVERLTETEQDQELESKKTPTDAS